jgi:hypothetical protein
MDKIRKPSISKIYTSQTRHQTASDCGQRDGSPGRPIGNSWEQTVKQAVRGRCSRPVFRNLFLFAARHEVSMIQHGTTWSIHDSTRHTMKYPWFNTAHNEVSMIQNGTPWSIHFKTAPMKYPWFNTAHHEVSISKRHPWSIHDATRHTMKYPWLNTAHQNVNPLKNAYQTTNINT